MKFWPCSCVIFSPHGSAHLQRQNSHSRMHRVAVRRLPPSLPAYIRVVLICTAQYLVYQLTTDPQRQNITRWSAAGTFLIQELSLGWLTEALPPLNGTLQLIRPSIFLIYSNRAKLQWRLQSEHLESGAMQQDDSLGRGQTSSGAGCQLLTSFPSSTSSSILLIS